MLKRWSIVMIVVALVALAAIPAGAAPAERSPYIIAECPGGGEFPEVFEFLGQDHLMIRGAANIYIEYVLENDAWREVGVNNTVANGNATVVSMEPLMFYGPFWGTFEYTDDGTLGDFSGTWSWGNSATGHASGMSTDGSLLKVTLGLDPAPYPELPAEGCFVDEFLVINPQG